MVRVKLPLGGVSPEQLEAFADGIERYVPLRKGHITTRQNIQMHHVALADAARLIRQLGEAGLSSREGCGNTVRNVTGDPRAGVLVDEEFDITPYAVAYVRYFVRHPITQAMPRKFKTAFASSPADNTVGAIHDLAFLPCLRDGVRGARVLVGGGTSIMPRVAAQLCDFVTLDDGEYLKLAEAVLRIFNAADWLRPNRARARIKVLIDRFGIEAFRQQVAQQLRGDWATERDFAALVERLRWRHDEQSHLPGPRATGYAAPNGDRREFERFLEANVAPQRQAGFCTVEVCVPRGDLDVAQLRGLAAIMREHCGGYARTTIGQNIVLRWVREPAVYEVWRALCELGLGQPGAGEITDVVSCPGTDSCNLAITSSMGLNRAIAQRLEALGIDDPLTRQIQIRISGCPNGCSQHHIADIGFYGAAIKVGEHTLPAYIAHLGGAHGGGEARFGQRCKARIPAKRVPEAVERWIGLYQDQRRQGESFAAFVQRVGTAAFEEQIADLTLPVPFAPQTLQQFIDWNRNSPFQVSRGDGECAV